MSSLPPSPRVFPRAVSEDFMKRLVATERLRGLCDKRCALALASGFYLWKDSRGKIPAQPAPSSPLSSQKTAPRPVRPINTKVVPETFVRQLIAAQRIMSQYRRFSITVRSWAFYRWEDSTAKLRALYPSMLRRWLKMGRIGKKIQETNMVKACLEMMTVQNAWYTLRDSARQIRSKLQASGRALRRLVNSQMVAAWNTWQAATELHWHQQITMRRAALRMRNAKLFSAIATWRSTAGEQGSKQALMQQVARRLLNSKLFAAWNSWRAAATEWCREQDCIRDALVSWLMGHLGAAVRHWRLLAATGRQLQQQAFGHHLTAAVITHGETNSHESPLSLLRDERLSEHGRVTTQQLGSRWSAIGEGITVALVSPMARSLETALLVFGVPSGIKILVEPALRDFEWQQTMSGALDPRHEGTGLSQLKRQFPQENIKWDSARSEEWWEPHGGFSEGPHNCVERILLFKERLLRNFTGRVAIVTHPRVAAVLTGSIFTTTRVRQIPCVVGSTNLALPATPVAVLPSSFAAFSQQPQSKCLVVLMPPEHNSKAEAVSSAVTRRVWRALETLCASESTVLLIVPTEAQQRQLVLEAVTEFPWVLSEEHRGRVHVLGEETRFEDSATATAAVLSVAADPKKEWVLQVLTDDWALPRALVLFAGIQEQMGWALIKGTPMPTAAACCAKHEMCKLFDAVMALGSKRWNQVQEGCSRVLPKIAHAALDPGPGDLEKRLGTKNLDFLSFTRGILQNEHI